MISAAEWEGKATRCASKRGHGEGGRVRRGRWDTCGCHPVDQEPPLPWVVLFGRFYEGALLENVFAENINDKVWNFEPKCFGGCLNLMLYDWIPWTLPTKIGGIDPEYKYEMSMSNTLSMRCFYLMLDGWIFAAYSGSKSEMLTALLFVLPQVPNEVVVEAKQMVEPYLKIII